MEHILLVVRQNKRNSNLALKYTGIINAFRRMGYCVWATYSENGKYFLDNGEKLIEIGKVNEKMQVAAKNMGLFNAVRRFVKKTDIDFKYCYVRGDVAVPGYVRMMKALKKADMKIAVEIPTYPATNERKTDKMFRKIVFAVLARNSVKVAKYIDVYLPMGEPAEKINGVPAVNIQNGVETELLKKREYKKVSDNEIHMLAIAKIARWHGYDRVIEGMKIYYDKNPDVKVYFHLVGPDGDGSLKEYERKIAEYGLGEYVLLEGPKYGDEANEYFNMADIAIASINIQGMKVVYPLKIVEYMARGIPFVYAKSQCQVRPDWEFCMSVPTDGTPLDIDELVAFSKRVGSTENVADKMREIAVRDCSWDEQMQKMIDYFENRKRM